MILLVLVPLLTIMAAWLGWRLGHGTVLRSTLLAMPCATLVVLAGMLRRMPYLYPEWGLTPLAAWLEGAWFAPPAAMLLALAAAQTHRRGESAWRRQVVVFSIFALLVVGIAEVSVGQRMLGSWPGSLNNADDPGPSNDPRVVLQHTGYTCGPSAAASLIRLIGADPEASEAELAPLCVTQRLGGASMLGIATGLRTTLEPLGWHVKIVKADWKELKRLRKPALVCLVVQGGMRHAAVVCDINEYGVLMADPVYGMRRVRDADFRGEYVGLAIAVYKEDPHELYPGIEAASDVNPAY